MMDILTALRMIKATAPNTPLAEAFALAEAIQTVVPSTETEQLNWLNEQYGHNYVSNSTQTKIIAIKGLRTRFSLGLADAKRVVDYYIDHPDPINW